MWHIISVTMRSSVLFLLTVSFAIFGFGVSLQCYSCPGGSSSSCEVKQECNSGENSCLKLTSGDETYTSCLRSADCEFMTLGVRYGSLSDFTFSCCQSELCNGQTKSLSQRFKDFFG